MIRCFLDNRFTIAMFTRQSGKSVAYVCYLLWTILFTSNQNIGIFANKAATARDILQKVAFAYEALPLWMQQGVETWNKGCIELENKSRIIASSTSGSAGRSGSYNIIILDEFAFVPKNIADEFMASVYPTISSGKNTKVIIVSTPCGMNQFYKLWVDAVNKRNLYTPITAPWNCRPGRDQAWLDEQLKQLGQQRFDAEVMCKFLGSANILVSSQKLESMIWDDPTLLFSSLPEFHAYEPINEKNKYIISVDTAHGIDLDFSAFSVIDVTEKKKYKQVAKYKSNKVSPEEFSRIIHQVALKYNEAHLLIEINDMGYRVADIIYTEYEYENIYCTTKSAGNKRNSQQAKMYYSNDTKLGLKTSKSTKNIGCSTLKTLIENDVLMIRDYDTISELSNFVRVNDSYQADSGHNDDLVMTLVNFSWLTTQTIFSETVVYDVSNTETINTSNLRLPYILVNGLENQVDDDDEKLHL